MVDSRLCPILTRGYNNYFIFDLKRQVEVQRLQRSCQALLNRHAILRSFFVPSKDKLYQVVMKQLIPEFKHHHLDNDNNGPKSVIANDLARPVNFVEPITRFLLIHQGRQGYRSLTRISYALCGGISLPIIVRDLKAVYLGHDLAVALLSTASS